MRRTIMINYPLILDYQLNAGWLAPYVDGLKDGKLIARQCTRCSRISFPPVRSCICGHTDGNWKQLKGTAKILQRATGTDGDFAMVRFDGADTLSVAALDAVSLSATTVTIKTTGSNLPQLILAEASEQEIS